MKTILVFVSLLITNFKPVAISRIKPALCSGYGLAVSVFAVVWLALCSPWLSATSQFPMMPKRIFRLKFNSWPMPCIRANRRSGRRSRLADRRRSPTRSP